MNNIVVWDPASPSLTAANGTGSSSINPSAAIPKTASLPQKPLSSAHRRQNPRHPHQTTTQRGGAMAKTASLPIPSSKTSPSADFRLKLTPAAKSASSPGPHLAGVRKPTRLARSRRPRSHLPHLGHRCQTPTLPAYKIKAFVFAKQPETQAGDLASKTNRNSCAKNRPRAARMLSSRNRLPAPVDDPAPAE